jgi:surfactin synthase thioesterase subunit
MKMFKKKPQTPQYESLGCLRRFRRGSQYARYQMILFPSAGAGAPALSELSLSLPNSIDTWVVQLRGRGDRLSESPLTCMETLVDEIVSSIALLEKKPIILFGHSMGSLIAYEVACRLKESTVTKLIVSGHGAPSSPVMGNRCHHTAPDEDFIADMVRIGGTPPEVLSSPELLAVLLPILRADYHLLDNYKPVQNHKLSVDVHACAGESDLIVTPVSLLAWQNHTNASFLYHWFKGGHFYFNNNYQLLISALNL